LWANIFSSSSIDFESLSEIVLIDGLSLGVSEDSVRGWEEGSHRPASRNLKRILRALDGNIRS
jgi:hypothetical protein